MQLITSLVALAGLVAAQTPPGFAPQVNNTLVVQYNGAAVSNGQNFTNLQQVSQPPALGGNTSIPANITNTLLLVVDLDVPNNGSRSTLLHWLAPNISHVASTFAISATSGGAPYIGPNPPAGDAAHRYVFLLYAQPSNFTFPAQFANINPPANNTLRRGFDLGGFVSAAKLSTPLAANYIRAQNTAQPTASTSFPPIVTSTSGITSTAAGGSSSSTSKAGAPQITGVAGLGMGLAAGVAALLI